MCVCVGLFYLTTRRPHTYTNTYLSRRSALVVSPAFATNHSCMNRENAHAELTHTHTHTQNPQTCTQRCHSLTIMQLSRVQQAEITANGRSNEVEGGAGTQINTL